ncbi:DUF5723 family protein [Fulvivirga lutea]|uniref:DUF5723 domain-containing protein n=1 Tax=Fulvivirga lutea TaxID=2810512 RepID=A0A974WF56_9BACT|nr:DUF5723 family protein [Fulvivirga lutea]QSE95867.1 hypothetical protein JR347_09565 [Fulvivirga lutea]
MRRCSIILALLLMLSICTVSAQNNLQLQYGYRGSLSGAKFLPSTLELGNYQWQIGFNYKLWIANRSLSYGNINDFQTSGRLTNEDLNDFISELDKDNIIGVGQDIMLLGVARKFKIRKRPITFSFAINERMSASFRYPKALLQLAWKGNKQFENKPVDIAGSLDARYFREFSLGTSFKLAEPVNGLKIRFGAAFKYYQGLAAIYMPNNYLIFETGPEGDYLSFDYNYDIFLAGTEKFSVTDTKGEGYGGSIGITAKWKKRYSLDIGLSDIGGITYYTDTQKFSDKGFVSFSGLSREDFDDLTNYADSLTAIFENEVVEGNSFYMPLGVRFQVQLAYHFLYDNEAANPGNLFFTYIQGFQELPGVTRRPRFSLGYNQRLWKRLYPGVSVSYGGFNNLAIGAMLSARFGKTRFGIHADDFTGAIIPSRGTGLGFGLVFQCYF